MDSESPAFSSIIIDFSEKEFQIGVNSIIEETSQ